MLKKQTSSNQERPCWLFSVKRERPYWLFFLPG